MLHRGFITEEDIWDWFRLVEIPPFWREKMIGISWNIPTRVDVRRWWDMGTVDEARLKELYTALGYHGKDLDDYILWTKVYVAWPDLIARYTKGWLSEEDVKAELVELGMPEERVDELMETKVKNAEPERVTAERDLTKAEIVKGVKKEVISVEEGAELLQDMGYSEDEAWYILVINLEALSGSPGGYIEFKRLTQGFRIATKRGGNPPPLELQRAEEDLRDAKVKLAELEEAEADDDKIAMAMAAVEEADWTYQRLLNEWREALAS